MPRSILPLVAQSVLDLGIPIVDNFEDHDPKFLIGPKPNATPLIPPYPLRVKPKENYDNVRAMFKNIKIGILLLDAI